MRRGNTRDPGKPRPQKRSSNTSKSHLYARPSQPPPRRGPCGPCPASVPFSLASRGRRRAHVPGLRVRLCVSAYELHMQTFRHVYAEYVCIHEYIYICITYECVSPLIIPNKYLTNRYWQPKRVDARSVGGALGTSGTNRFYPGTDMKGHSHTSSQDGPDQRRIESPAPLTSPGLTGTCLCGLVLLGALEKQHVTKNCLLEAATRLKRSLEMPLKARTARMAPCLLHPQKLQQNKQTNKQTNKQNGKPPTSNPKRTNNSTRHCSASPPVWLFLRLRRDVGQGLVGHIEARIQLPHLRSLTGLGRGNRRDGLAPICGA